MNADKVVTLIVRGRPVRQNISAHQVADREILGTQRDDRQSECVFVSDILILSCGHLDGLTVGISRLPSVAEQIRCTRALGALFAVGWRLDNVKPFCAKTVHTFLDFEASFPAT